MRQLNARLIRQKPWLWSIRLHHAIYFAVLLNVVGITLAALVPLNHPAQMRGFVHTVVWLLIILQVVAMLIWRQGQDRFHVVREAGRRYDQTGWREFFGYVFALVLLMSSLPIFLTGLQMRIQGIDQRAYSADFLMLHIINNQIYANDYGYTTGNAVIAKSVAALNAETRITAFGGNEATFLNDWVQSAEFDTMPTVSAELLLDRLAHYSGIDRAEIDQTLDRSPYEIYDTNMTNFSGVSSNAYRNARLYFDASFKTTMSSVLISWLVTVALAIHFGMVRLLYKYNSQTTIVTITAIFFGTLFFYWFGAILFGLLFFNWLNDVTFSLPALLFIGLTAYCYRLTVQIRQLERYSHWHALALAFLPLLLGALPFAMLLLIESLTGFNFIDNHLFDSSSNAVWSIYPYGGWLLYTLQFAYLPFIPLFKHSFVRLESLPHG
jgi:hypothetical protein